MKRTQWIGLSALILFISLALVFYFFDVGQFVNLENIQKHSLFLAEFSRNHFILSVVGYLAVFISVIAFSIPISGPLTLLGGFLFGVLWGSFLAITGATVGATIAFLLFRRGLNDVVRDKYKKRVEGFKKKIETYGVWYLLILHFSTVVPYAVINVLAALAGVPLRTFVWTTVVGFVPLATVYTFAASRLTKIGSMQDIFSFNVLLAFSLLIALMLIPILLKWIKKGGNS